MSWLTVAPGIHQRRYDPDDVSVIVIEGTNGLLLVDTRSAPVEGEELRRDIRERFDRPVRWVVNTHAHYDHTFGNQVFGPGSAVDAPIYGHAGIAAHFDVFEAPRLEAWRLDPTREPPHRAWADVQLTPPSHPLAATIELDLGGRVVELRPQPPAHTDTDLVVVVPAARAWIVGDLVEESGPPMYGSGSYPFGWPVVLDALVDEMEPGDIVVPGHGQPVDRAFVAAQADDLQLIAERFRAAHDAGRSPADALATHADWPVPADRLGGAVRRAYAALDGEDREPGRGGAVGFDEPDLD